MKLCCISRLLAGAILGAVLSLAEMPALGAPDMLTDDELAKMQTSAVDTRRNTSFEFTADFKVPASNKVDYAACRASGKVPFSINCALNEIKTVDGETLSQRQTGTVEIRVLDKDKNVVAKAAMPLEKMCSA